VRQGRRGGLRSCLPDWLATPWSCCLHVACAGVWVTGLRGRMQLDCNSARVGSSMYSAGCKAPAVGHMLTGHPACPLHLCPRLSLLHLTWPPHPLPVYSLSSHQLRAPP
jgi:hypothetical protein